MGQRNLLFGGTADVADGRMSRREAMRRLALLGVGVAGLGSIAACGSPEAAPISAPGPVAPKPDPVPPPGQSPDNPQAVRVSFAGPGNSLYGIAASDNMHGIWAAPAGQPKAALLVVHDDRGLTPHMLDVVGRFAALGYGTLCADLMSGPGIPVAHDPGETQIALTSAPMPNLLAEVRAGIAELQRRVPGAKIGSVGFGLGGTLLWDLLVAGDSTLSAAVPFYGLAPDSANFTKSRAAVLALYPETDRKLNESQDNADIEMHRANIPHHSMIFAGTADAFFDDTDPRYDGVAATKAWQVTRDWLKQYLLSDTPQSAASISPSTSPSPSAIPSATPSVSPSASPSAESSGG